MKVSKAQKKFIKANYKDFTLPELAEKSGLSEKELTTYLKETGRFNNTEIGEELIKKEQIKSAQEIITFLKSNFEIVIALVIVTFLAYINSLGGQFVSDDIPGFVENPAIKTFSTLLKNFYLQGIIQISSFKLFGLNPVPLHLISIGFHILAAILVFIFVSMIFGKKVAIPTAFLFALHPVNTEAVAWISGINYITNGVFFLITALLYILYKNSKQKVYLFSAFALYTVALFFNRIPWTITIFPLIVIIDQFLIERKLNFKNLAVFSLWLIPTFLFFVFLKTSVSERITVIGLPSIKGAFFWDRFVYTFYSSLKLFIFPKDLTLYHEGEIISQTLLKVMYIATIAFFALVLIFWKRYRKVAGLLLFFIVALSPALSPIQIAWFVAERYMYIGTIALCTLIALTFIKLEEKIKVTGLATFLTVTLLFVYGLKVVIRNSEWSTPKNLWLATVRVSPNSPKVHNNLGGIYRDENDYERAIKEFQTAIVIDPNYADAMHNLGNTYIEVGDITLAEEQFKKAIQLNPNLYQAYLNLGVIEYKRENFEKAKGYFEKVLDINPENKDAKRVLELLTKPQ